MFRRTLPPLALALLMAAGASAQPPTSAPAPPQGGTPSTTFPVEGVFTLGASATDTSDYLGRVGEYQVLHQGTLPTLGLRFWGERGASRFEAFARHSGDAVDQSYGVDVNVKRRLTLSVSYDRMPHRLDHDPLTWMDAASNINGTFVVGHTDHEPSAQYALKRGELKSRLELAVPFARAGSVKLFASHRQEMRDGYHQALTTNHCATCHTDSFTRQIQQRTRDLAGGARLQLRALTVDYTATTRRFSEEAATPLNTYDRARQPATLADVFLNRVSYDERFGPLPFDRVPGLEKTSHDARARVSLPKDASLTGAFTRSTSRNRDTDLKVDFTGTSGRFVLPMGRTLTLRAGARHYEIDGNSLFVDVNEPIAPAGPSAGKTYAQAFPQLGVVDYERVALSRRPTNLEVDLVYRPWKKTTIRGGYEWESMERGGAAAVEKTTTNTVRASIRSTPWKRVHFQARGAVDWVKDPFTHENAAMPLVLQPFQSPGNVPFTGLQYFEFYRTRQANLTMFPTRDGQFEESVTWSPAERLSMSLNYRYRRQVNDDLSFSQWDQSTHLPGAQLWLAPGGPVTLSAGYTYQRERTDTGFATLAFVG